MYRRRSVLSKKDETSAAYQTLYQGGADFDHYCSAKGACSYSGGATHPSTEDNSDQVIHFVLRADSYTQKQHMGTRIALVKTTAQIECSFAFYHTYITKLERQGCICSDVYSYWHYFVRIHGDRLIKRSPIGLQNPLLYRLSKLFLYCHVNKKSTANFFNHECRDANCAIIMRQQSFGAEGIYAEKISVEWPKIETLRDIYADEEMTLNYGLGKNISIIQRYSKKTNWCLCRTCTALPQNERRRI
jgi:hypothetical protein